ncbi:histone-lysine N-methyltransferase 2C-like isoform X1 [Achroia grisella]|uniref:histone-lysine N-methyltransferase 2C-like isoform X1 n=2 Tax=Achroia grisella TaxID=688607 RepID=UPI0027D1FC15|nr:histone-lysine N-methyltransferase 2C-like isoform X1 [Achroia grisella]
MSEIKYKQQILAAIDHLRSRKSRPDINRICKFMLKCYKVAPKDTKADLKRCLKEKSIFKVDYKDNVSYRNAAKWRKKSSRNSEMANSSATSERRIITSAIATLIYQDQSYLENGIAFEDLVRAAASQESKYSKKELENIINKELSSGSLVKLHNGNLALGPADHDGDSSDSFKFEYSVDSNTKMTSSANSSCRSSPQRMRGRPKKRGGGTSNGLNIVTTRNSAVRVGERRKMAKKVFDPSDNNVPSKRKRGRPVGSLNKSTIKKRLLGAGNQQKPDKEGTPLSESQLSVDGSADELEQDEPMPHETSGVCSVCHIQKPRGSNDRLVECRDCNNKAHLSCLQSGSGILKPRPDNTWQCPHCKTCLVCCETNDAGILTVCSICSDAYHALCHTPRIPERLKAWDQWECNNCLKSRPVLMGSPGIIPGIEYESHNSPMIDPFLKPHEMDRAQSKLGDLPIDPSIPDITNWTTEDVYEYFMTNFPEAAPILKEQEFDGQALNMARRADIVIGLGLPLGPGLALYRIVVKLQTRKDDWTMCWG